MSWNRNITVCICKPSNVYIATDPCKQVVCCLQFFLFSSWIISVTHMLELWIVAIDCQCILYRPEFRQMPLARYSISNTLQWLKMNVKNSFFFNWNKYLSYCTKSKHIVSIDERFGKKKSKVLSGGGLVAAWLGHYSGWNNYREQNGGTVAHW